MRFEWSNPNFILSLKLRFVTGLSGSHFAHFSFCPFFSTVSTTGPQMSHKEGKKVPARKKGERRTTGCIEFSHLLEQGTGKVVCERVGWGGGRMHVNGEWE